MKSFIVVSFVLLVATVPLFAADKSKPLVPTHADVSYGPHSRNVLDFWQATGPGPRPLLVHIHGGGWVGGDKKLEPARVQLLR